MNLETQKGVSWIIKHRPTCVKDVVGSEAEQVQKYLDTKESPHFLFHSTTGGTGKTSLALAMVKDLGADCLNINGSEERGIDTVRDKVKLFVSTMTSKPGVKRVVFLDEMDQMTKPAQLSLKSVMETSAVRVIFILTCNNITKVDDKIRNRCRVIEFGKANKTHIKKYLEKVCNIENLKYEDEGLNKLIDLYYPSIRRMVDELQYLYTMKLDVTIQSIKRDSEKFELLWTNLKNKKVLDVRREILEQGYDEDLLLRFFFLQTYEDKSLSNIQIVKLSKVLADINYKFSVGADKRIQIGAGVFDIFQAVM